MSEFLLYGNERADKITVVGESHFHFINRLEYSRMKKDF